MQINIAKFRDCKQHNQVSQLANRRAGTWTWFYQTPKPMCFVLFHTNLLPLTLLLRILEKLFLVEEGEKLVMGQKHYLSDVSSIKNNSIELYSWPKGIKNILFKGCWSNSGWNIVSLLFRNYKCCSRTKCLFFISPPKISSM